MQTLTNKKRATSRNNRSNFHKSIRKSPRGKIAKKQSSVKFLNVLSFIAVLIAFSFFYTWVRVQAVHIGYDMAVAKKIESEVLEVNKRYKTEIATLTSPVRIKQLARNELGLSIPQKDQVVILNEKVY